MRERITVSLPEKMKRELDMAAKEDGVSRSEIVRRALRGRLAVARFRRIRAELVPRAQARGIFTDQDVFDRIS